MALENYAESIKLLLHTHIWGQISMSAWINTLRNYWDLIVYGLRGLRKDLKRILGSRPHKKVLKTWLAVLIAGAVSSMPLFLPWPLSFVMLILAALADYIALHIVYAMATWFYLNGRHQERAEQKKKQDDLYGL